jgi:hypothetical protein
VCNICHTAHTRMFDGIFAATREVSEKVYKHTRYTDKDGEDDGTVSEEMFFTLILQGLI